MMDFEKYTRQYSLPPEDCTEWISKKYIDQAPIWCSVDLRDGNQALVVPMSVEQKLRYFELLTKLGFREIEVGFPAASETEFRFIRRLIEENRIPDDVTIQVLTQAREPIIHRTFEAIAGAKKTIVHIFNATSRVHREQVFGKTGEEILKVAVDGAAMLRDLAKESKAAYGGHYRFEYSPEYFTATEMPYALEICHAVADVWADSVQNDQDRMIINLPGTVELSMPHVYAEQVSYIDRHLHHRDQVILSLHPHNDRGSAISDAEMGILAGAQRVEGTLFGMGERAGNVDLITLAMNLYAQGIDPKLDLEKMNRIVETYEDLTGMKVDERHPYSGILSFAAFSGSHQDAIAKSRHFREVSGERYWTVPYLPIDPSDIGQSHDTNVIRINSQSGKGGVGYILEQHYGLRLPKKMRESMGYTAKHASDILQKELTPEEVFRVFVDHYENRTDPYEVQDVHFRQHNGIVADVTILYRGKRSVVMSSGNGRLNAVSNALRKFSHMEYQVVTYEEHSLERSSSSRAIAYVGIEDGHGNLYWGAGVDVDIIKASVSALTTAVNHMAERFGHRDVHTVQ